MAAISSKYNPLVGRFPLRDNPVYHVEDFRQGMTHKQLPTIRRNSKLPAVSTVAALAGIPEEEIWLAKQKSVRTRRAYKQDVDHFMRTLGIKSIDELRAVDHRAVIFWERHLRETDGAQASTVRRRLAALSSLFKHLVEHGYAVRNPVADVRRPTINREEGSTLAFSKRQARKMLDAPSEQTIQATAYVGSSKYGTWQLWELTNVKSQTTFIRRWIE